MRLVHAVVPVHDEADLLAGCLLSVRQALAHARRHRPDVVARATVVLDACTDASPEIATEHAGDGLDVVAVEHRNVGAARSAGIDRARRLAASDEVPTAATWIATTDADSLVAADWLTDQVAVADAGADVVLGRVEPDATAPAAVLDRWLDLHPAGQVGVHGAHLGFRLSSHDAVGGFSALAVKEDLDLYQRLLDAGARYGAATSVVLTSSRALGRTPGGFAGFIASLTAQVDAT